MTVAVLNSRLRPLLEARLPDWIEPQWYDTKDQALAAAPLAEIGWFDMQSMADMAAVIQAAERMRWLHTIIAGLDFLPLAMLADRGVRVSNGAGINALTIAEYVVMGMLSHAKGYRDVVRAQDRHQWLTDAPGKRELFGGKVLILGYGAIGQLVDQRLRAFGMETVAVRRTPGTGTIGPDQWRARLSEFDWIVLALPQTGETRHLIGAAELAAMKRDAVLVNVGRGGLIDQEALITALAEQRLGGAFLDVTTPEPLPPDHPLWSFDNVEITMHLSGRSQTLVFERGAERFLRNCAAFVDGAPMEAEVDLARGY